MQTLEEYRELSVNDRFSRLERTRDELEKAFSRKSAAELARRPDVRTWSATEIVCHSRDVEELFQGRFHTILAIDEPRILVLGSIFHKALERLGVDAGECCHVGDHPVADATAAKTGGLVAIWKRTSYWSPPAADIPAIDTLSEVLSYV